MACSYVGGGRSEYPSKGIGGADGATQPDGPTPKLKNKNVNITTLTVHYKFWGKFVFILDLFRNSYLK